MHVQDLVILVREKFQTSTLIFSTRFHFSVPRSNARACVHTGLEAVCHIAATSNFYERSPIFIYLLTF
uniref:Uncharacterized protein n=1 Tax=Aegilops tauschii subsp. strangulata TaxID=200361 RepID=A0A453KDV7_AEGTS